MYTKGTVLSIRKEKHPNVSGTWIRIVLGGCSMHCVWCKGTGEHGSVYGEKALYGEILKMGEKNDSGDIWVAFSGGEPFVQSDFLYHMLRICGEKGMRTAVETGGMTDLETLLRILPHIDMLCYDLNHMDDGLHRRFTGVSNSLALANLAAASRKHVDVTVRVMIIPGFNDDVENICRAAEYAAMQGVARFEIAPFSRKSCSDFNAGVVNQSMWNPAVDMRHIELLAERARFSIGEAKTEVVFSGWNQL
ncbi:MAG: radical SAM protein [Emergencia sp.]